MFARVFLVTALFLLPAMAAADPPDFAAQRVSDAHGRTVVEYGVEVDGTQYVKWYHYAKPPWAGGGGKGGGDGGDGGSDPGTDCEADQNKGTGFHWSSRYDAFAADNPTLGDVSSVFAASAETWDAATGTDIFGTVTRGSAGTAGEFDGVNQFAFTNLGNGGTIAVTTTWYNRFTGEAVESDAQYNTFYQWATDGRATAMDLQNIATHEIGHTLGLDHPNGPGHKIGCLTMYAYGSEGETQKRTLGDGDILGIQGLYGG